jgi:hypothetical protein
MENSSNKTKYRRLTSTSYKLYLVRPFGFFKKPVSKILMGFKRTVF